MLVVYIHEMWIAEIPPDMPSTLSTEVVEQLLLENHKEVMNLLSAVPNQETVLLELQNLKVACQELFGKNFDEQISCEFNADLAKRIHKLIGKDVVKCAGAYRTKVVSALGSTVAYELPKKIEERMEDLFRFTREKMMMFQVASVGDDEVEYTEKMLILGGLFFSEFLLIHPFMDGNGRTSRLLLSYLLKDLITLVPFSLYLGSREKYVSVLEERIDRSSPPYSVVIYVAKCARKTSSDLLFLLQ
eukprot:TRINITY_DN731_c1_g1_i4.p1 TRINITY_DN731_c1_g1~~TRINITY_DN731_c1_g1_i4.p1  ORF type:complete len:245 (-),score=25.72 TRINITY_DN731_c1_g1_i4:75-809(-)